MRSSDELPPDGSVPLAWAKSPNRRGASSGWLNLVDHSIDVAAVGAELLRLPTIRKRLSALAKRPLSDIDVGRLCFFIGLHDAGKVNHGFQAKLRGQKPDAGHIGPLWSIVGRSHVFKAHRTLCRELRESLASARWRSWFDDRETERDLWAVILAHHGSLPDPPPFDPRLWGRRDGYDPLGALKALAGTMIEMFPSAFEPSHPAQASPHTRGWTGDPVRRATGRAGFPAHAGMDLRLDVVDALAKRLPRTRGDGPAMISRRRGRMPASPHTRGWTRRPCVAVVAGHGFPAHAGMDPSACGHQVRPGRLPRTRGDGPRRAGGGQEYPRASPHTRGWTLEQLPAGLPVDGFPAHAGMDPCGARGG